MNLKNNNSINKNQLLNNYIKLANQKYGARDTAIHIYSYIKGNTNAITRDCNMREQFMQYLSPQDIINITNGNCESYIDNIINNSYNQSIINNNSAYEQQILNNSNNNIDIDMNAYNMFIKVCEWTIQNHNVEQLMYAIKQGQNGDFRYFSGSIIGNYVNAQDINNYCVYYLQSNRIMYNPKEDITFQFCGEINMQVQQLNNNVNGIERKR